jgi:putative aldouronate transport system substrate-binding protein
MGGKVMKTQRAFKRALVALTVILMLISTAACTTTQAPAGTSAVPATSAPATSSTPAATTVATATTAPAPEPATISVLVSTVPALDFASTAVGQEIKKRLNITVTNIVADDEKVKVLLSTKDLPDIPMLDTGKYQKQAIDGGNVIALDDLLAAGGPDIMQNVPDTVSFAKQHMSSDGKLYFLPTCVGADMMGFEPSIGFDIRWDYYKDLGFPKISNEYDLLNVLKQMVDAHPKTDEGKTVYGVGGWGADFGGMWSYYMPMACVYGYINFGPDSYLVKVDTNEIEHNYSDPNSPLWKTLAFFNKANQMKIFDKDTFTMKFNDFQAKCDAGQEMYTTASWAFGNINGKLAGQGKGWEVIPLDWGYQNQGSVSIGRAGSALGISNNCKTPDRAMELLNFLYSYDGSRLAYSGVENQSWTMINGVPTATAQFLADRNAQNDAYKQTGASQSDIGILPGLSKWFVNPADKTEMDLAETLAAYSVRTAGNNFLSVYCKQYGVSYPAEIFLNNVKAGKSINHAKLNSLIQSAIAPPPDDIKGIDTAMDEYMLSKISGLVLAATDADFNTLKTQVLAGLKAAKSDTADAWWDQAWAAAKAAVAVK